MTFQQFVALAVASGTCVLGACSKSPPVAATSAAAKPAAAGVASGGNACDQSLLTIADLAGLLDKPVIAHEPLKGDPQTCIFTTGPADAGGPQLRVSLRPGLGRATIETFTSGHMNDYAKWQPLAGVGDSAVWMPDLHELQAEHTDVLCDIQPDAMSVALGGGSASAQQQKLGALCNTIFARFDLSR